MPQTLPDSDGHVISDVGDPVDAQDVATKAYVDASLGGALSVTDGSTTVTSVTTISVTGLTVIDAGGGEADLSAAGADITVGSVEDDAVTVDSGPLLSIYESGVLRGSLGFHGGTIGLALSAAEMGAPGIPSNSGVSAILGTDGLQFFDDAGELAMLISADQIAPALPPVVPVTTPSVQDVIDALVALGLITQSD